MTKQLIHKRENLLFGILLAVSILVFILLLFSIIGIYILLFLAVSSFITNGMANAYIRLNGVQLTEKQFPDLHQKVLDLCKKMEVWDVPEVYILESGGMLNAFATKASAIFGKNMVILYADLAEMNYQNKPFDIDFIIAHELAHIKRSHILKNIFTLPGTIIPFLGSAYSRSCEYTCDRMAAFYTEKPENAINSMLVLASGKELFTKINVTEYLQQYNSKKGFFAAMAELFSTHPSLPKRIEALEEYMNGQSSVVLVNRRGFQIAVIATFSICLALIIAISIFFSYSTFMSAIENGFSEEYSIDSEFSDDPNGELMTAIYNGDTEQVEQLLIDGYDPNEFNIYGESPLTFAINNYRLEVVPVLLEYGADPNLTDLNDWNPITSAVYAGDIETCRILLEAGASPYTVDSTGLSAVDYAADLGFTEFLSLLEY